MTPLRIVLVMIEPPLPFGNAVGRWYYVLLKGLVERGHRVTAFATCSQEPEIEEARALFPAPRYDLRCYPHPRRLGVRAKWETLRRPYSFMFSAELCRDLTEQMHGDVDVLHLEGLWSGWLGLSQTARAFVNVHYLYQVDFTALATRSVLGRAHRRMACSTERRLLRRYPIIATVSPALTARVRRINPAAQVATIPFAFDTSLYAYRGGCRPAGPPIVTLVGSFNWLPTYSAALRVLTRLWPEIKRRVPAARLRMVGRDAGVALRDFHDRLDVEFHSDVPDVTPFFRDTDVLLYPPPAGSGVKVKVLEAFALGVPVVTTRDGVEGLPVEDGLHAEVCDDDRGLIDRTVQLLADPSRRQRLGQAARALVVSYCDPGAAVDALERVYATLPAVGRAACP